jgi:hypothetical protein
MDIKDLTERMHAFVFSKGWYEPDSRRPQTPRNLAISLSLEANEVLEHFQLKKLETNASRTWDEDSSRPTLS